MSVTITIQGTSLEFPTSGESPNWAAAIVEFAQAVETALTTAAGPNDIAPQSFTIDSFNPGTNVTISNLQFPNSLVRGAFIRYTVARTTNSTSAFEAGLIKTIFNGTSWEFDREAVGDGKITFTIDSNGQVKFTTTTLAGTGHTGKITFAATALQQV